ncbi:MAG TPA: sulfite exporter TauE/SafE family protein, partial [Pseudolabrys sp.]|nr:sulfite exporter TauE/SafE family protein [Pseudolabrys sp.]
MTPGRAPQKSRKRSRAAVAHWRRGRESLAAEFLCQQAPLIAITMTLGCAIALVEYGYIPGNGRPFQTAGVAVAIWRLIWMGVWTGYTMALVGQAAGIFALPYSTSVLGFSNPHVTPTMLVLTFISPFGALPGFRRSGQWNPGLAADVCPGGAVGALTGPFVRATVLADPNVFRATLGVALALFGLQLCWKATRDLSQHGGSAGRDYLDDAGDNRFAIRMASLSWTSIEIHFG